MQKRHELPLGGSRSLRPLLLAVDVGFLVYWAITFSHVLPPEWLYQDYTNPILVAWNLSFVPIDLLVSATGLTALRLDARGDARAVPLAAMSLVLTSASGLMAVSYWALRGDFELAWWAPNLFLLLAPWTQLGALLRRPLTPTGRPGG